VAVVLDTVLPFPKLSRSVNVIIHNAWRLDFNLSLGSFEPHVAGTRRLLDLAFASQDPSRTRVLLTSSVAVAQSWPKAKGAFPEEPLDDPTWSVGGGYGESKYVAERLLVAARDHGLQTTSLRIGQISGSKAKGTWATTDWLPILVKSSIALGSLPEAKGVSGDLPSSA
jgi:thioester reductase-like protein